MTTFGFAGVLLFSISISAVAETVEVKNCEDTTIKAYFAEKKPYSKMNFNNSKVNHVAELGVWSCRSLTKFIIPETLKGRKIKSAKIKIFQSPDNKGAEKLPINLYEVLKAWKVSSVTWEDFDKGGSQGETYGNEPLASCVMEPIEGGEDVNKDSSITIELNPAVVQKWLDNPADNRGIIWISGIRLKTGDSIRGFCSAESDEKTTPVLIMELEDAGK
jgi:hypothetical protein